MGPLRGPGSELHFPRLHLNLHFGSKLPEHPFTILSPYNRSQDILNERAIALYHGKHALADALEDNLRLLHPRLDRDCVSLKLCDQNYLYLTFAAAPSQQQAAV